MPKRRWEQATARAVKLAEENRDRDLRREKERQDELRRGTADALEFIYKPPPGLEDQQQEHSEPSPVKPKRRQRERIVLKPDILTNSSGTPKAHGIYNEGYELIPDDDDDLDEDDRGLLDSGGQEKKRKKKKKASSSSSKRRRRAREK